MATATWPALPSRGRAVLRVRAGQHRLFSFPRCQCLGPRRLQVPAPQRDGRSKGGTFGQDQNPKRVLYLGRARTIPVTPQGPFHANSQFRETTLPTSHPRAAPFVSVNRERRVLCLVCQETEFFEVLLLLLLETPPLTFQNPWKGASEAQPRKRKNC